VVALEQHFHLSAGAAREIMERIEHKMLAGKKAQAGLLHDSCSALGGIVIALST
jgi:hypothetical protein